jgi:hypothetical protein
MNAELEEPTPATAPERAGAVPTLAEVIETSPVLVLDAPLYFVRSTTPVTASPKHLAVIADDIETTIVTSDEQTVAAHQPTDLEGPFTGFRLQISLSFGAPGFIAAAASACAEAGINVCVLSTFSFDYLLVPTEDEHAALAALERAGFPMDPRTAR